MLIKQEILLGRGTWVESRRVREPRRTALPCELQSWVFMVMGLVSGLCLPALRLLNERVEGDLSIEEICRAVGYSRAYIFKEFKAKTGKSIMTYYTALKIKRAKQLLRERELSVRQISERLGFDSANYFSKVFRAHTGQTPTSYQKRAFASAKK